MTTSHLHSRFLENEKLQSFNKGRLQMGPTDCFSRPWRPISEKGDSARPQTTTVGVSRACWGLKACRWIRKCSVYAGLCHRVGEPGRKWVRLSLQGVWNSGLWAEGTHTESEGVMMCLVWLRGKGLSGDYDSVVALPEWGSPGWLRWERRHGRAHSLSWSHRPQLGCAFDSAPQRSSFEVFTHLHTPPFPSGMPEAVILGLGEQTSIRGIGRDY